MSVIFERSDKLVRYEIQGCDLTIGSTVEQGRPERADHTFAFEQHLRWTTSV